MTGLMKLLADGGRNAIAPQWLGLVGVDDVDVAASWIRPARWPLCGLVRKSSAQVKSRPLVTDAR